MLGKVGEYSTGIDISGLLHTQEVTGSSPVPPTTQNRSRTTRPGTDDSEGLIQSRSGYGSVLYIEAFEHGLTEQSSLIMGTVLKEESQLICQLQCYLEISLHQVLTLRDGLDMGENTLCQL